MAKMKNMLCIDPSGSHLAYVISEIQNDELYIKAIGMLWTKSAWSRGQRFLYMDRAIDLLVEGILPEYVIDSTTTEAYFINPKQKSGIAVIPIINGFIEKSCAKHNVSYNELSSSSWRGILGIKGRKVQVGPKLKNDYKQPTKELVEQYIGSIPAEIVSNITLKPRGLPHDVTDALAIVIASAKRQGIDKVVLGNAAFTPMSSILKLNKISKEIK